MGCRASKGKPVELSPAAAEALAEERNRLWRLSYHLGSDMRFMYPGLPTDCAGLVDNRAFRAAAKHFKKTHPSTLPSADEFIALYQEIHNVTKGSERRVSAAGGGGGRGGGSSYLGTSVALGMLGGVAVGNVM